MNKNNFENTQLKIIQSITNFLLNETTENLKVVIIDLKNIATFYNVPIINKNFKSEFKNFKDIIIELLQNNKGFIFIIPQIFYFLKEYAKNKFNFNLKID